MRKALLLFLVPLLALATLGLVAPPAAASATEENHFLSLLNQARRANGLSPMVLDSGLSHDARRWSSTMGAANLLYHTPNQQMMNEVARVVPAWQRIGENVGVGYDVQGLHNAFWNSPGHKANMLSDFNRVGIGVVFQQGKTWVTFRFVKGPAITGSTGQTTVSPGTRTFPDVPDNAYYADAVAWAVRKKVTNGVGTTGLYQPNSSVTRAEMATFLWRMAGQPKAKGKQFADVSGSAYYARAVKWMRSRGLTTGVGGTNRYAPGSPVTREQMAAFLHRFAGDKKVSSQHRFVDVPRTSFANDSISWLQRFRITKGTAPGRFSPGQPVSRAQMATFLHRLATTRKAMSGKAIKIRL
jgi:hypothetical protein